MDLVNISIAPGTIKNIDRDIRRVQTYLEHRPLRSTQRHAHLSNSEVAKDVKIKLKERFREVKGLNKKVQKIPEPIHILSGAGRV